MDFLTLLTLILFVFGMAKWCDEGETLVGQIFLEKAAVTDLWVGLYKDGSEPAEGANLAGITECTVENGYARIQLGAGDWTEGDPGVWTNLQKSFEASGGDWGDVTGYFITDCASGTGGNLIAVEDFSDGPYAVNDGWIVKVTPKVTIS